MVKKQEKCIIDFNNFTCTSSKITCQGYNGEGGVEDEGEFVPWHYPVIFVNLLSVVLLQNNLLLVAFICKKYTTWNVALTYVNILVFDLT